MTITYGGTREYAIRDYWQAVEAHYGDETGKGQTFDEELYQRDFLDVLENEKPRFVSPRDRIPSAPMLDVLARADKQAASTFRAHTYRGLMMLKNPFDLASYARLIWELQPATIIELGSLQGGSGLWFAHQLDLAGIDGATVQSFDVRPHCVHATATHPRLQFHFADLRDPTTLDREVLERLPHPWIVVDDAHIQVLRVLVHLDRFVQPGDYYVVEDCYLDWPLGSLAIAAQMCDELGYEVDTDYCDGFGPNMTNAPNAWLRKSARRRAGT